MSTGTWTEQQCADYAERAVAERIWEHGQRQFDIGRQVAYEWTGWAHRLDSLLRSTPDVPHITYLDELGERVEIPLLANADIRDVVTELLVDAITRADALAAELKRHSTIAMRKSTEAAQTLSPDVQERAS